MTTLRALPLLLAAFLLATSVAAQGADDEADAEDSEHSSERRQRAAAANAYDRGSEAFLAGDYADAARWFELANRFLPSDAALRQAARAHMQADNVPRAATVAQHLRDVYGEDEANREIADDILSTHEKSLLHVTVRCSADCSLLVDGEQVDWPDFYLMPDVEHTLVAEFDTGERERTFSGVEGQHMDLHFEAPPPPPSEGVAGGEDGAAGTMTVAADDRSGVSPVFVYVGAGMTALAAGALAWSAIDMNKGVDAYENAIEDARASRSQADVARAERLLAEGDDRERRTEILIGVTAGLAVVTATLAILADWSHDGDAAAAHATPTLAVGRDGAAFGLGGRF